jgi:adenylate cyclase class 2
MNEYKEHEIKVLDVNVEELVNALESIGAKKVYDDYREIMALDTDDREYLNKQDKLIRVTDEGSIKVTMHVNQSKPEIKEGIKFKVSRMKEVLDFFAQMGIKPISDVKARRISFELGKIDFDIDMFPAIPPFLEIDIENLDEEGYTVDSLLEKLGISNNKVVVMGTEDIHQLYSVDYFEEYKVK